MSRAPIACSLGRRVAVDWTWASLLPHDASLHVRLGGPVVAHSHSPFTARGLPALPSSSGSNLRLQSNSNSPPLAIAMAPTKKEKRKKPASSCRLPPAVAPAVDRSIILNPEALNKVRSALATIFKECGRTTVWPASHASLDRIVTEVRFFVDALWAGLVPPFSTFFNAVLSHYQIRMMHLGSESITLLAVFAFICEAMVGIPPSVALLRHFFSLRLSDPTQCSGCVGFFAVPETAASGIDFGLPPSEARFRERWLYVDVGVPNPLLSHPTSPAVPHSGWDHEMLASPSSPSSGAASRV